MWRETMGDVIFARNFKPIRPRHCPSLPGSYNSVEGGVCEVSPEVSTLQEFMRIIASS